MADCPKCGQHLRLVDWKQKCPHCGTNIVLYDLQERLMKDADIAEVQNYHFQKKIDRLKASFVGTKLSIARIFTSLLPVGALFLPLFSLTMTEPFAPFSDKVSLLTIYNSFDSIDIGGMISAAPMLFCALLMLALSVVALLVHFFLLTLACSPKAKIRAVITNAVMLLTTVLAPVFFFLLPEGGAASGQVGLGTYLYIALMIANVVIDVLVLKHPPQITHKQCYVGGIPIEEYFQMVERGVPQDEIRAEQYKRLQQQYDEKEAALKAEQEKAAKEKAEQEADANG